MENKILLAAITGIISVNAHAGLFGLTIHSRANCINNESVSWDATSNWFMQTDSVHNTIKQEHWQHATRSYCKRSAAVCWAESMKSLNPDEGQWLVTGTHTFWVDGFETVKYTQVNECSIYDGWFGPNTEPDHPPAIYSNISIGRSYADILLHFNEYRQLLKNTNDITNVTNNSDSIKTVIPWHEPKITRMQSLGYVPVGAFEKNKWTGKKEFMAIEGIGNCSLSEFHMDNIVETGKKHDSITGDGNNGYLYRVTWRDGNVLKIFQCANKINDPGMLDKMKTLVTKKLIT